MKIKTEQKSIPFRLCFTGPGASLMLTQRAPNEIVIPNSRLPSSEKIMAGNIIANVVRIPSARYWLKRKFLIFLAFLYISLFAKKATSRHVAIL